MLDADAARSASLWGQRAISHIQNMRGFDRIGRTYYAAQSASFAVVAAVYSASCARLSGQIEPYQE